MKQRWLISTRRKDENGAPLFANVVLHDLHPIDYLNHENAAGRRCVLLNTLKLHTEDPELATP